MKLLTNAFVGLLMGATISLTLGQEPAAWVEVAPGEELFRVLMPQKPDSNNQRGSYGQLSVNGKTYTTSVDGTRHVVWSFVNLNFPTNQFEDSSAYLDACADLVWEFLLKPHRDKLSRNQAALARMTYLSEVSGGPLPGREYLVALGDVAGVTRIYAKDTRIYVLAVLGPPGQWKAENFFRSFTLKPGLPVAAALDRDPVGIGSGIRAGDREPETDYNRVFGGRETTEKARIVAKPEPQYTESARKYGVQGTVIMRAVLSKEGEVTKIYLLTRLPHGLTEQALAAARSIRFTPASKDGRPVSQFIQLEYNFNLY